jgi:hypothetical protein
MQAPTELDKKENQQGTEKVTFWRLGLGLILLLLGLMDLNPTGPAELKPANTGEAFGYYGAAAALIVLGLFLTVRGIQILRRKPSK